MNQDMRLIPPYVFGITSFVLFHVKNRALNFALDLRRGQFRGAATLLLAQLLMFAAGRDHRLQLFQRARHIRRAARTGADKTAGLRAVGDDYLSPVHHELTDVAAIHALALRGTRVTNTDWDWVS